MRKVVGLLCTLLFSLAMPAFAGSSTGQGQAEQEIQALIERLSASLTQGPNLDAAIAEFSDKADVVDPRGNTVQEREQIRSVLEEWLPIFQGANMSMPATPIRLLFPDVAIVDGHCTWTQGSSVSTFHVTAVLQKHDGRWLIEALRVLRAAE